MTVQDDVSVKDTLGLVIDGLADERKLGEDVGVAVSTNCTDQLCGQGSSSSLDGHCMQRCAWDGVWEELRCWGAHSYL